MCGSQRQARHQQAQAFKALGNMMGFGKIKECDFKSRVTLDTDGAQEAAANTAWTAAFFGDSDALPLALRTKEPQLAAGKATPNEYLLCFRGISLRIDQQTTGFTVTELMEIASVLGKSKLVIKVGPDVIYEREIANLLVGVPGVEAHSDGQATPLTVRDDLKKIGEGDDFDDPIVLLPGASLTAEIHGQGAWTTTDDIAVDLLLHGWVATIGEVSPVAKFTQLSDVLDQVKQKGVQAVRARFNT